MTTSAYEWFQSLYPYLLIGLGGALAAFLYIWIGIFMDGVVEASVRVWDSSRPGSLIGAVFAFPRRVGLKYGARVVNWMKSPPA